MIAALGYVFLGVAIASLVAIVIYMRRVWREEDEREWELRGDNTKGWR